VVVQSQRLFRQQLRLRMTLWLIEHVILRLHCIHHG
jgi:hypothetical protein